MNINYMEGSKIRKFFLHSTCLLLAVSLMLIFPACSSGGGGGGDAVGGGDPSIRTIAACEDSKDNDGDTFIDFPADQGCSSYTDTTETGDNQCDDGIDNDGDTLIDFPADPECIGYFDIDELQTPECHDGVDNDGDTLIDLADPGCFNSVDNSELGNNECDDGTDNDGDTTADFLDPGCLGGSSGSTEIGECQDGVDNEGDTYNDFPDDPGCTSASDNNEYLGTACDDSIDNDGDTFADLVDPGCLGNISGSTEIGECQDGIDNDGDTLIDFPAEPECSDASDYSENIIKIIVGTGTGTWSYPLRTSQFRSRTQSIYLASEIGKSGPIISVALDVTRLPGQEMNNFNIRMKHTTLDYYATAYWEGPASGWTTVYQDNVTINETGWHTFMLTTPFSYNGVENLMIDFSFNNASSSLDGYAGYTTTAFSRSVDYGTGSYGDPLNWSGTRNPFPSIRKLIPNIALEINSVPSECNDSLDNDGDTLTDYPSDPGCAGAIDTSEYKGTECDDGTDNDGDTFFDYPADSSCAGYYDLSETYYPYIYVWVDSPSATEDGTLVNPYKSIQVGLDAAIPEFQDVLVALGTYFEEVSLKQGVDLRGGYDPSFTSNDPDNNRTIVESLINSTTISGDSVNVLLDGFQVNGNIFFYLSSGTISNNYIVGNSRFTSPDDPYIIDNTFEGNIVQNPFWGWAGYESVFNYNTIDGDILVDVSNHEEYDAYLFVSINNSLINGGTINIISHGYAGVVGPGYGSSAARLFLKNSIIQNSGGIYLEAVASAGSGDTVYSDSLLSLESVVIYNSYGITAYEDYYNSNGEGNAGADTKIIIHNSIIANSTPWHIEPGFLSTQTISYSDFWNPASCNCTQGPGVQFVDPMFNPDFTLQPISTLIDAGDPNASYDDAIPPGQGAVRNDMGAFGGPGASGIIGTRTPFTP